MEKILSLLIFLVMFFILRYVVMKFLGYRKSKLIDSDNLLRFFLLFFVLFSTVFLNVDMYILYILISIAFIFNVYSFLTYKISLFDFILNVTIYTCFVFPNYIWLALIPIFYKLFRAKKVPVYNWIHVSNKAEEVAKSCRKGEYIKRPLVILGDFNDNIVINGKGIIVNVKKDKAIFRISKSTHELLGTPNLYEFCEKMSKIIRRWLYDKSGKVN
ncbi:hypothetical protein SU69_03805 [Thermosipho melanesiensis]|nr:hypothetical protein [Thermosipho melanesiensis]APT74846.1 hypothetical protein BW47_04005 [Thermosipho melanesiensis]OOC35685.1 hypothetical protein SU68_03860 [Thermosipho melanesiensis]OOC38984.1 hypothetical protein SU69_03805 [Thermosipho melanesiensis]OOC39132.1 hypothetical protein SU70_03805 [Thermosipho melanesiensis]OOC41659.1 hypothetical protein SU71_03795 [Thermosipho melanesiensis]